MNNWMGGGTVKAFKVRKREGKKAKRKEKENYKPHLEIGNP